MNTEDSQERTTPDECSVGDWIRSKVVPDWPVHERLHAFLPGSVTTPDPVTAQVPATPSILFEQSSLRSSSDTVEVVWVRVE